LDYLVWQLVFVNKKKPNRKTEFPIFRDAHKYECFGVGKIEKVPASAKTIIKGLQPYNRPAPIEHDPLWMIHQIDIRDKHQLLTVIQIAILSMRFGLREGAIDFMVWPSRPRRIRVEDGTVLHEALAGPDVDMDFQASLDIAFEPGWPGEGGFVLPVLTRLINFTERELMPQFSGFFP
jgi:hypothetical protein